MKKSKKTTRKKNFYLPILTELKTDSNLTRIKNKLLPNDKNSKQKLNYYLRELKKKGFVINPQEGIWKLTNKGKNPTNHSILLEKDMVRGHAYVWNVYGFRLPEKWDKRLDIIKKKNIKYKLVGALKTTPRIKALGRKVWLCNDHLRIYDTKKASYYGDTAIESRVNAFMELLKIVKVLENKLGFYFKPFKWSVQKEHYALIKNDLAIDQNRKGNIMRISDEDGEWLLIDDSLEQGGELETIGKKALPTNLVLKPWWNDHKKHNFKVTPSYVLNGLNTLTKNQMNQSKEISNFAIALNRHIPAYEGMKDEVKDLHEGINKLTKEIKSLKEIRENNSIWSRLKKTFKNDK